MTPASIAPMSAALSAAKKIRLWTGCVPQAVRRPAGGVQIELETDTAGGLIERLLNYDVEAAFIAEPVSFERIETRPVFEERLVLVAPATFPELANTGEISGRTIVAFEEGCAYRRYLT